MGRASTRVIAGVIGLASMRIACDLTSEPTPVFAAIILPGLRRIVTAVDWPARARATRAFARRVESTLRHG